MDKFNKSTYTLFFWGVGNDSGSTPGVQYLDDLFDVSVPYPSGGDVLYYDPVSNQWINKPISELATPAPPDTSVQFNQGGSFGGSSSLVWDYSNNRFAVETQAYFGTVNTTTDSGSITYITNDNDTTKKILRALSNISGNEVVIDSNSNLGISDTVNFAPQKALHVFSSSTATIRDVLIEYDNGSGIQHFLRLNANDTVASISSDSSGPNALLLTNALDATTYNNSGVIVWNNGRGLAVNYTVPTDNTAFSAPAQVTIQAIDNSNASLSFGIYFENTPKIRIYNDTRVAIGTGISYTDTGLTIDRQIDKERFVTRGNIETWWSLWIHNKSDGFSFVAHRDNHFSLVAWRAKLRIWTANWNGQQFLVGDNISYYDIPTFEVNTVFEARSSSKGSLPAPRLTTTQRNNIGSKPCGLLIYNLDVDEYQYYDCATNSWRSLYSRAAQPDKAVQVNRNGNLWGTEDFIFDYNTNELKLNGSEYVGFLTTSSPTISSVFAISNLFDNTKQLLYAEPSAASFSDTGEGYIFLTNYGSLHIKPTNDSAPTSVRAGIVVEGVNYPRIMVKSASGTNDAAVSVGVFKHQNGNHYGYIATQHPLSTALGIGSMDSISDYTPTVWTFVNNYGRTWVFGRDEPSGDSRISIYSLNTTVPDTNEEKIFSIHETNALGSYAKFGVTQKSVFIGYTPSTYPLNKTFSIRDTYNSITSLLLEKSLSGGVTQIELQADDANMVLRAESLGMFSILNSRSGKYFLSVDSSLNRSILISDGHDLSVVFESSAVLDVRSISGIKGSLPAPRLSTIQRDSIVSPACGLLIFNIDINTYQFYDCTDNSWKTLSETNPGGINGSIQYNNGGAFDGSPNLLWDNANNTVNINGYIKLTGTNDPSVVYKDGTITVWNNKLYYMNSNIPVPQFLWDAAPGVFSQTGQPIIAYYEPAFFGPENSPPNMANGSSVTTTWINTTGTFMFGDYGPSTRFPDASSYAKLTGTIDWLNGATIFITFRLSVNPTTALHVFDFYTGDPASPDSNLIMLLVNPVDLATSELQLIRYLGSGITIMGGLTSGDVVTVAIMRNTAQDTILVYAYRKNTYSFQMSKGKGAITTTITPAPTNDIVAVFNGYPPDPSNTSSEYNLINFLLINAALIPVQEPLRALMGQINKF